MPELPEVHTTVQGLNILINERITSINCYSSKLRYKIPRNISKLINFTIITKTYRIGKYIIIDFQNHYSLIFHLGMSGRLRLFNKVKYNRKKHDHCILKTKKHFLVYNDARKFGFIDTALTKKIYFKKYINILGIDALDKNLNSKYLISKIKKSVVPIKQILLNQKIISGIGNIYASEILFDAKISPLAKGYQISEPDSKKLIKSVRKILLKAIKFGGTTLKDYISTDGTLGNFQKNFKVYNRAGKKIKNHEIIRIIQYGRSTFYCPKSQIIKNRTKNNRL